MKYLSTEDFEDFENQKNEENNTNNKNIKKTILKNDLTDFKEEVFMVTDYKKLDEKIKNLSATKFLKNIMKIVTKENQIYSRIRDSDKISDIKKEFDNNSEKEMNSEFEMIYSNSSLLLQNIISNLVRKKLLIYNENEILPLTLNNSYLDILIDISATMSEEQRISSLLISTGLSLALSKYGVKIRISVFHERDCVWALTNDFSYEDINIQLSRLRDALSSQKRIQSFPADALRQLKNSLGKNYTNKYCQILISNLVSGQIVDKNLNWNELGQRIIVFGLKSIFDENFSKENNDIYNNILKIPTSDQAQIVQEFFETFDIISQNETLNEPYTKLVNAILDTLSDINENQEENDVSKIKIDDNNYNFQNKKINYNNIENIKSYISNNLKEQNYFSQNISFSNVKLSKFHLDKIPAIDKFPSLTDLEKISNKHYLKKDYSMEEIISFVISLLTPLFRQIMPSNIASGKIPCTSGGSLSIQGIKKWICSGFTYTYIFEKQGGKSKKKYYLSYVIDLSKSALLLCNYSHCIATIVLLLIAPSTVEDNDDIYIDVIINTIKGVKIVDFNSKCSIFQNIYKITEIISIINEEINYSCCPGSCVYTAYKLLSEKREDKKIFLITDGFVSNKYEIQLVLRLIENCENEGIDFVTIGVGSFPNGIKEIYPNCCYSPTIRNLQDSLFSCFFYSKDSLSNSFEPILLLKGFNEETKEQLKNIIHKKPKDKKLEKSINGAPTSDYLRMIQNENTANLEGFKKIIANPKDEPYYDDFDDFKILVVILYLGNEKHDMNITTDFFEKNAGKALKKKGFKYDIVYSYGDAIKKLSALENNNCPYSEVWIFCSRGDGSLPNKAEDKDPNKITIFLEMVADFNKKGGALFLFCDNYPWVLEANLLLKEYLKLEEGNNKFEMKGSYNKEPESKDTNEPPKPLDKKKMCNKKPKKPESKDPNEPPKSVEPVDRLIYEKGYNTNKNGFFEPDHFLKCPGKADKRLSLRIGLIKFSEGRTLSYAETNDNSEDYSPFTPFAYLTDPTKKRPFILYYDPKIETKRGPIVLHGGFTSAFYDFEEEGTGRLVISIACWLMRKEELAVNIAEGNEKVIPHIPIPEDKNVVFDKWIKKNMFSILILDVSGSMKNYYKRLFDITNEIIKNQKKNEENEGVVILFGKYAKAIIKGKYRLLDYDKDIIELPGIASDTNFFEAFTEAEKYIYNKNTFMKKMILFLTDGISDSSKLGPICDKMIKENFQINIIGFENNRKSFGKKNTSSFKHLEQFASKNCFFTSDDFKEIEMKITEICAAE